MKQLTHWSILGLLITGLLGTVAVLAPWFLAAWLVINVAIVAFLAIFIPPRNQILT